MKFPNTVRMLFARARPVQPHVLLFLLTLSAFGFLGLGQMPPVHASNITSCSTASDNIGIVVSGSDVWVAEWGAGDIGHSTTSSCSVTNYYASSTFKPHLLTVAATGVYYTDHDSQYGCLVQFNTATDQIGNTMCPLSNYPEADDIATDPTNTNNVWASLYSANDIEKWVTSGSGYGYTLYSLPNSCTNPEGVRVDSSGNVWVAGQGCTSIFEYSQSSSSWVKTCSFNSALKPWYIALDNTNNQVWFTQHTSPGYSDAVVDMAMSSCNYATTGALPSGDSGPLGIDLYGYEVYVAFNGGSVDVYNFAILGWVCGPDGYSGDAPYGISHDSNGDYWVAMNGASFIAEGYC